MTPTTFKAIRERAGLSQDRLAALLRIADGRAVRRWEAGTREISGPVTILMELIDEGRFGAPIATPSVCAYKQV